MNSIFKSVLGFALIFVVSISVKAQDEATQYLMKGYQAALQKDYTTSIQQYSEYIKRKPQDFRGYFNRATSHYNNKDFTQSIADLNKSLELNPVFAEAYLYRAYCYNATNQYNKAIADFNHLLAKDPKNAQFLIKRAECHMENNKHELALNDVSKALVYQPREYHGHFLKGNCLMAMERYEEAAESWKMCININSSTKILYYKLGLSQYKSGQKEAACESWQIAKDKGIADAINAIDQYCDAE